VTTSDIHGLSGAYALDAVDDLERVAFERHLHECDTCALEVRELRETVARLADTAAVDAPAALRTSVLEAVARTPQLRPGRADRNPAAARGRWRRFAAVSVAAGVIAAGVSVGTYAVAHRSVDDARRDAVVAQQRAAQIERVLAAPDVRVVSVRGRDGGTVNVAVARSLDSAVAVLSALPDPGRGRIYQLWMVPAGGAAQARSVGTLPVGRTAAAQVLTVGDALHFGVSIEPEGGSLRPTVDNIVGLATLGP
jgi:anti-sigma factor RsiW